MADVTASMSGIEFIWNKKNSNLIWLVSERVKTLRSPLISVGKPCHVMFYLYIHAWYQRNRKALFLNYSITRLKGSFLGNFEAKVELKGSRVKKVLSLLNLEKIRGVEIRKDYFDEHFDEQDIVIRCKIKFSDPDSQYAADLALLKESIHQLLSTVEFSDLTLSTTDEEFFVHKFILRKRAPKLLEYLGLSDENCKIDRVKVDGISTALLKSLLQYIYSGKLDDLPESLPEFGKLDDLPESLSKFGKLDDLPESLSKFGKLDDQLESLSKFYEALEKFHLEVFSSVVHLDEPVTMPTQIRVSRRIVGCKVGEVDELSDKIIFEKDIDFECARFWMKVALVNTDKIQTTIKCRSSSLEEDILMSWVMYERKKKVKFDDSKKMIFSSTKQERTFTRVLNYSPDYIKCGLDFKFKITISNGRYLDDLLEYEGIPSIHEDNSLFGMGVFRYDISKLGEGAFHNEGGGDVVLCFDGGKLRAHKAILAAWSPIFTTMFQVDMIEKNTGEVNIPDIDYNTGLRLLSYMYSAEVSKDGYKEDMQLYAAAHKYQVSQLVTRCSTFLASQITPDNVCEILVHADQHDDENLYETVCRYLAPNPDDVTSNWLSLIATHSELASKTLESILRHL